LAGSAVSGATPASRTDAPQHLDRVRAELDASADLAELRRPLVNDDFNAVLTQPLRPPPIRRGPLR